MPHGTLVICPAGHRKWTHYVRLMEPEINLSSELAGKSGIAEKLRTIHSLPDSGSVLASHLSVLVWSMSRFPSVFATLVS